uniref:Uncharacterized protein n=1 Tax=Schizophyllum commune (strain H4-8 / FGSC 9210) TaxID=578458 RepID=D8PUR4_SCHCM
MTLVKKRSLIDVNSLVNLDPNVVQGADVGGESGLGGDEHSALVASTPSLSSELRDWVAWYRAGLVGSSSDLIESGGGLDELTGVLNDCTGGLDDDVLGAPGDRSDGSDDRADPLDDRTGPLDEHTAAVDEFDDALGDEDSALDEYTDALEDHTGDLVNDAIAKILRFNDEAIRKASIGLGFRTSSGAGECPWSGAGENPKSSAGERPLSWVGETSSGQKGEVSSSGIDENTSSSVASGPAKATGSLPDPSWGVWRREAWYVAKDQGPSNGRRETSTGAEDPSSSTKRKLGPSTPEYEPGASTSTRELGNSMPKNEIRPTPSPAGTPASHAPLSPVFDSPETFSTRRTTPSSTKVALPHASPTARRPSPSVRRPSPRRPSSLEPPPFSRRPQCSSPLGNATSDQGNATSHQGHDGQRSIAEASICRRWSSPPYFGSSPPYSGPSPLHSGPALLHSGSPPLHSGPSPPHPASPPPHSRPPPLHSGPPPSISVRHSSLSRANIRNVLDALPALSRGRSAPPRATISNATNPNAPSSTRATSSGTEASIYPSAHATTSSPSEAHPVPSSSRLTSTPKPADAVALKPADAEKPQARDFEILLSPPSSLRALPSLTLGDVPLPARPPTFKLSQVPVGLQTALRDAEHLVRAAKEHLARAAKEWTDWRVSRLQGISEPAPPDDAALDDDALRRDALDDIARAIHDTRRMLHKYKTTEIKLDKDPKRTDARCYTEGLRGMMGTCAAFVHGMARDPRACDCAWLCDVRDCVVAHEARIRSAIHALANHDIQARLAELDDLALSMS